jgi:hypothetical protein
MTSDGSEIVNFEWDRTWKDVVVASSEIFQHLPGRTEDNHVRTVCPWARSDNNSCIMSGQ